MLLGAVNGQQTVEDLGISQARVLLFNEFDHRPDGGFVPVAGGELVSAQAPAKAFAEEKLVCRRERGIVEVVVAVGVEHAVARERGSQRHGLAQQRLQAAGGPGIAAGLDRIGHGKFRIESARPAREFGADAQKCSRKKLDGLWPETQCDGRKRRKCVDDASQRKMALGLGAGNAAGLALDAAQALVIGLLACALLSRGKAREGWKGAHGAAIPNCACVGNLPLYPRPTVALIHVDVDYDK
jgi:hypothetical protein